MKKIRRSSVFRKWFQKLKDRTGKEIIILLCGGDKSTQKRDIVKAKEIAALGAEE